MNLRVRIEEPVPGNDLDGIPDTWAEVSTKWADIKPLSGREYEQAQQMHSTTTHTIKTHYQAGATAAMRLVHGERVFEVESVRNLDERNRFSIWRCQEQD